MLNSDAKLRHLPFFEELAALEENSEAWHAASAGLVTLRLVESWLESGGGHAADDEWNYHSVCAAVERVSERSPMQALLSSVLAAMGQGQPSIRAVTPPLMAYAKALEWDAKWELAVDVYQSLLARLHPVEDGGACVDAFLRLGICHRSLHQMDSALTCYASVFEIGTATGDLEAILRSRIGEAEIAMLSGNLPKATSEFDALIDSATVAGLRDVQARALMGRSGVATMAGQYELAIRLGYEALQRQDNPREKDRVLSNIAAAFLSLGVHSAAHDAYLILSVTAREQYMRWTATLNLLELSVATRSEVLFEQYRRQISGENLPPQLAAGFELTLGMGLQQFGQMESARIHLERAVALAARHGIGQYLMVAESALLGLGATKAPPQRIPVSVPEEIEDVALAIKQLRELVGVG